jgi:hypothetical protein
VSRDGASWQQTLSSHDSGSVAIIDAGRGNLFAYGLTAGWVTKDPRNWGAPKHLSLPDRAYLGSVASGGSVGLAFNLDRHNAPASLLRAVATRDWVEVPAFRAQVPGARGLTVQRVGDHWIVAGTSGSPNRPAAWVSADLEHWNAMPASLQGSPGGTLSLVATIGDRVVMLGTAPELDRFYTLDLR